MCASRKMTLRKQMPPVPPENISISLPMIVGRKEYETAKEYLRSHAGFDFDKFLEETDADRLLDEPMGSTEECLSINEVADYIASVNDGGERIERERSEQIQNHLLWCNECCRSIKLYQELEIQSQKPSHEMREGRSKGTSIVYIYPKGFIRFLSGVEEQETEGVLELVLLTSGRHQEVPLRLVPSSVVVSGFIDACGCTLQRVQQHSRKFDACFDAYEAFSACFQVNQTNFPRIKGASPICDWVTVTGKTETNESFSSRSLVWWEINRLQKVR